MIARISIPKQISRALYYNEHKVQRKQAVFLSAGNILEDATQLSPRQKLKIFQDRHALNQRAKTNCLHISLNFDPSEKIPAEEFQQIAQRYLQLIGFGEQPYFAYAHQDAGHPHLHIVTTAIQPDGKRISLHHIGRGVSELARKKIETEFGLICAAGRTKNLSRPLSRLPTQKIVYGKSDTRRAIAQVLDAILPAFIYCSLPELNAILKQYHLRADPGQENSRMRKHHGLQYRLLDAQGNAVGVPIKASSIYHNPTLATLEKFFVKNQDRKAPHKRRVQLCLELALRKKYSGPEAFAAALKKENLVVEWRRSPQGMIYGVTFIDLQNKCVINGSDLGKGYAARALLSHLENGKPALHPGPCPVPLTQPKEMILQENCAQEKSSALRNLLDPILYAEAPDSFMPFELRKDTRQKKRRFLHRL